MITKEFGVDFFSDGGALTLGTYGVVEPDDTSKAGNEDGWTIKAVVHEDYFEWVNWFEACHDVYGKVWGDFEDEVFADSEEGFNHFYENHKPKAWNYDDI